MTKKTKKKEKFTPLDIERKINDEINSLYCFARAHNYHIDITFDELAIDSLDVVDLAISLEKIFGINISDSDMEKNNTPRDVINHIKYILSKNNRLSKEN